MNPTAAAPDELIVRFDRNVVNRYFRRSMTALAAALVLMNVPVMAAILLPLLLGPELAPFAILTLPPAALH